MGKRSIDNVEVDEKEVKREKKEKKEKKAKKEKKEKKEKKAVVEEVKEDVEMVDVTEAPEEVKEEVVVEVKEKKAKKEKKDKKKKTEDAPAEEATGEVKEKKEKKEKLRGPNGEKLSKEERKALKKAQKTGSTTPAETGLPTPMDTDVAPTPVPSSPKPAAAAPTSAEATKYLKDNFISITPAPGQPTLSPMLSFAALPLAPHPTLLKAFNDLSKSFTKPSPIQSAVWPYLLAGNDCVGVAETGSGKTLAFAVPAMLHILERRKKEGKGKRGPKVCIVSPTRELAMQISDVLAALCKGTDISSTCIYGGVPKDSQRSDLKKCEIVIATPGRLNDLVSEGSADLSNVTYLVLDEADRMLDTGFEEAIRAIVTQCATCDNGRQTLMFTATWPTSVRKLASTFMKSPAKITIGDSMDDNETGELRANTRITQKVEVIDPRGKDQRLLQILATYPPSIKILVFALYKKEAARIEETLKRRSHHKVCCIHGDMAQPARTASINAFRSGSANLLVATDVAARGLDIPAVMLVLNATFPLTVEDYVHRIGRTGRAGTTGEAITLFTEHEKDRAGALVNVLKKAGQTVPEELAKWGGTVKKKGHAVYGAFFRETDGEEKKAVKIKFED